MFWQDLLGEFFGVVPPVVMAAFLFGVGVLFLLFGWPVYRIALVTTGVLIGAAMGLGIAVLLGVPALLIALPLGVVVGMVSLRLERVGAFVVGGLCGAIPLLVANQGAHGYGIYVAAALAFLIAGLLTVFIWKPMVILGVAVLGASLVGNGILLGARELDANATDAFLARNPYLFAVGMGILTLMGILFQSGALKSDGPVIEPTRPKSRKTAKGK
jgi:hypothetical protein